MTFKQLIALCEPINVSGPEPEKISMLRQDSRKVSDGDVFIAIRGLQVDGHRFIEDAIGKGASVIICEEDMTTDKAVSILKVTDTRSLIGPLAQAFEKNPADEMKVIGITGTNGKTTVSTLTYQVLQELDTPAALLGTVAKRIGDQVTESKLTTSDPIELAADMRQMAEAGNTHLVMEVSSHALDQQRVNGIRFDIAAFTNLSHDHLDYHNTLKDYACAKKILFESLDEQATAIINGDDDQAVFMISDCAAQTIIFSFNKALDVECQILGNSPDGLVIRIGKKLIRSTLMGVFNAYNITETFLICRALGFDADAIAEALQRTPGAPGRLERIKSSGSDQPTVLIDYAHTPDALENVLRTLADLKTDQQKLHVVFGCGGNRDQTKRPKMAAIAEKHADKIIVTSDNPRNEDPDAIINDIMPGFNDTSSVERVTDRKEAIIKTIQAGDKNSMILIAGKGHETYQEIAGKRHHFDDREVAREALDNRNNSSKSPGL